MKNTKCTSVTQIQLNKILHTQKIVSQLQKQTQNTNKTTKSDQGEYYKNEFVGHELKKMSIFIFRCRVQIRQSSSRSSIIFRDLYTGAAIACHLFSRQLTNCDISVQNWLLLGNNRCTPDKRISMGDKRVMIGCLMDEILGE